MAIGRNGIVIVNELTNYVLFAPARPVLPCNCRFLPAGRSVYQWPPCTRESFLEIGGRICFGFPLIQAPSSGMILSLWSSLVQ